MIDCLIRMKDLYVLYNKLHWTLLYIVIWLHKDLLLPPVANTKFEFGWHKVGTMFRDIKIALTA